MNQGIAFSRTLRALDADDFRASKLGLVAAALVLCAWVWWMFAARVPQYESTSNVQIESGRAIAVFPPDVLSRLQADQPALVHVGGATIPARVQSIAADHAELVLTPNPQSPIPASPSASAEIEVSRVSPAAIALRTLTGARR
ncbi:MAG: hypothetical protein WBE37_07700 [Bryobacteraceae bacterium]